MLSACHVGPSRSQRRRLPFQPTINPGASKRNRFISRSLKRGRRRASASRIRNHHGIGRGRGARTRKSTSLWFMEREITTLKLARRDRSNRKNSADAQRKTPPSHCHSGGGPGPRQLGCSLGVLGHQDPGRRCNAPRRSAFHKKSPPRAGGAEELTGLSGERWLAYW
jgi:hypothetical protein